MPRDRTALIPLISALRRPWRRRASTEPVASVAPPESVITEAWQLGTHLPALAPESLAAAVHLPGDQRATRLGQGLDFEQLRPYQPGEPANRIDWRISARTRVPMVRLFREPAQRQCHVVIDSAPEMYFGTRRQLKLSQALTAAHLLTAAALHQNLAVSLHVPGVSDRPCPRPSTHRAALLHQLVSLGETLATPASPHGDWPGFRHRLARTLTPGQVVIVLSDFLADFTADSALNPWVPLASAHRLIFLSVFDPAEAHLPDLGTVTFAGQAPNPPQRVDTHDPAVRAAVSGAFSARQMALASLATATGGAYGLVSTERDPSALLQALTHALLGEAGAPA